MTIAYPLKSGLYVNLTNRCPCACEFCLRKRGDGVGGSGSLWLEREPSAEEVRAAVDASAPGRFDEVVFCGYGEPTERLDVMLETARHIRATEPSLRIRLNTNGLSDLVNGRETAPSLEGLFDVVSVSLNAPDPDEYVRMCRPRFGRRSYGAMLAFARGCRRYVPEVVMTVVGSPVTTPEQREACRAVADSVGARLRVREYEG
ncbi:MAG: TIGR04100 family radical SAM protein [Kiritimatiellae bacterium]|nr:TIGR04100 family radical SAM protein [Kiritimatiellia bacterium]